jgi:hypothetical protein
VVENETLEAGDDGVEVRAAAHFIRHLGDAVQRARAAASRA